MNKFKKPAGGGGHARSVVIAIVVLAVVFGSLFAWRKARTAAPPQGAPPPLAVAAMVVQPQTVPTGLESVGALQAVRQVTLAPESAGRVVAIRFEGGARVGAGTTLVQLDDAPERADRAAAKARADYAKVQLERSKQLQPTGAEPKQLLDQRRAEYDQAVAAVRQLDARIAQKQVRAPFAGELGLRKVNPGQFLNPGDPVATLTALDELFVNFTVPQQELAKLRVGAPVEVKADAWPDRVFHAKVNAIEPLVGADTRNVSVQALLPNPGATLRPGMYVTARLVLPSRTDAVVVPATAIQTSAAGDNVIVIRGPQAARTGTAAPVQVQTGQRLGDKVVVLNGLKPGDVVITEGQLRVQPGAKVNVTTKGG